MIKCPLRWSGVHENMIVPSRVPFQSRKIHTVSYMLPCMVKRFGTVLPEMPHDFLLSWCPTTCSWWSPLPLRQPESVTVGIFYIIPCSMWQNNVGWPCWCHKGEKHGLDPGSLCGTFAQVTNTQPRAKKTSFFFLGIGPLNILTVNKN